MGLEKVVETLEDLPPLLRLLTGSATGQLVTTYVNLITSPRRPGEKDGPQEVHLVHPGQRPLADLRRPAAAPDPAVRALRHVPEPLPGLHPHRRPRLRLRLPRADRQDPHPPDRGVGQGRAAASPLRACAGPARRSARSRSRSPPCCGACGTRATSRAPTRARPRPRLPEQPGGAARLEGWALAEHTAVAEPDDECRCSARSAISCRRRGRWNAGCVSGKSRSSPPRACTGDVKEEGVADE